MKPILLLGLAVLAASDAKAAETTTYTYDALGRLTASSAASNGAQGYQTAVAYDPAGNRKTYQVANASGSTSGPTRSAVVVVPLRGLTVLPLPGSGDPF